MDKAISFIADAKQLAPDKPFFLYFPTGADHAPHQVPKEWADKYKGKFDDGWDAYREKVFAKQKTLGIIPQNTALSRHDPDVPDGGKLSADERKLCARMMEVFAGFLEHTDHHIGRLIDFLTSTGELDNTLIMVISDNGASSEGGPTGSTNENKFFNNVPDDLQQSGFNLNVTLDIDPDFLTEEELEHGEHCRHPSHQHSQGDRHHHDDDVKSLVFHSDRAFDPAKLGDFLECHRQ
jgi:arylsulfatase A-like enzyme